MNVSISASRLYPGVHVQLTITTLDAKAKDLFLVHTNTCEKGNYSGFIGAS